MPADALWMAAVGAAAIALLVAGIIAAVLASGLRNAASASDTLGGVLGPACLFQKTQPWCLWPEDDGSDVCRQLTQTPIKPPAPAAPAPDQLDKPLTVYLLQLLARFGAALGHGDMSYVTDDAGTGVRFVGAVAARGAGGRPFVAIFDDAANDAAYAVVRGTHSTRDWEADLTYQLAPWGHAPAGTARPSVHKGAYGLYNQLRQDVAATLAGLNRKALFVAGHSLGGAIASFLAFDAASTGMGGALRGLTDVRLTTFGSMRPGTPEFAAALQQAVQSVACVVNLADIVPALPPTWLPDLASQRCKLYQYALPNGVWAFNAPQGDLVSNHMLPVHFKALTQGSVVLVPPL